MENVIVITGSELNFLDRVLDHNILCEYSSTSKRSMVASTIKEKLNSELKYIFNKVDRIDDHYDFLTLQFH